MWASPSSLEKKHNSKPPHWCHTHLYLLQGACPWAPTPRGCVGGQWHLLCPVVTYPEWTSSQLPAPAGDTAPATAQPPAAWVGPKGFQFHAGLLFSFWFYFCTPGPRRTRRVLLSVPRWTESAHRPREGDAPRPWRPWQGSHRNGSRPLFPAPVASLCNVLPSPPLF